MLDGHGFSRPEPRAFRFGIPDPSHLEFFGNVEYAGLFDQAIRRLEAMGGVPVEIDFAPFLEAGRLLYQGPWLAERTAAVGSFLAKVREPLCIGTLELEDGEKVKGFLCEAYASETAKDISSLGGWREYLNILEW